MSTPVPTSSTLTRMSSDEMGALEQRYMQAMERWSTQKSAHEVAEKACVAAEKAFVRAKDAEEQARAALDAAHEVVLAAREAMREELAG